MARKWFGSRSAMKNASATGPAPRIAASMMSRMNPVTRDSSVKPPTVRMRSSIRCEPQARRAACPDSLTPRNAIARLDRAIQYSPVSWIPDRPVKPGDDRDELPRDGAPDGGDDAVLGRLVEIGMHRQADDLLGEAV